MVSVTTFATGAGLSERRSQEDIPRISINRRRNELVFISKWINKGILLNVIIRLILYQLLSFRPSKKQNIAIGICYFKPTQPIIIVLDGLAECYATRAIFLK